MTDKTSFSLDFTIDPASSFKPLPDLVAFDLCRAYPVPGGNLLLHNTRNGKRAMVMPEVHASLLRCGQFQTIDQHVANIIESNPSMQGQQADMHNVLQSMLDAGIMISANSSAIDLSANRKSWTDRRITLPPLSPLLPGSAPKPLNDCSHPSLPIVTQQSSISYL